MKRTLAALSFLILFSLLGMSQKPLSRVEPVPEYIQGQELFRLGNYLAARQQFENLRSQLADKENLLYAEVYYYEIVSALRSGSEDVEAMLAEYLSFYPENSYHQRLKFEQANIYFENRNYARALSGYNEIDPSVLTEDELIQYQYQRGVCLLQLSQAEQAKDVFQRIKDLDHELAAHASYQYAHLLYLEGDYASALRAFESIENNIAYRKIIPLYKVQILYKQGEIDQVLEIGPEVMKEADSKRQAEIAGLIASAYFHRADYAQALQYYEVFERSGRNRITEDEHYMIGYAAYQQGDYPRAISQLQMAADGSNLRSQQAWYYLGNAYHQFGQDKFALSAYKAAALMDYDQEIADDALFCYAKIAANSGGDPYGEALEMMEAYVENNPASGRLDEAREVLVSLYLRSGDLGKALSSIEKNEVVPVNLQKIYQDLAYNEGLSQFSRGNFETAIDYLKKAQRYKQAPEVNKSSNFWIAESFARLNNNWGSRKYYALFLEQADANDMPEYARALYGMGWAYFENSDYSKSIQYMDQVLKIDGLEKPLQQDALLKRADAHLSGKQYAAAIKDYELLIQNKFPGSDYAYYQKALAEGASGNLQKKAQTLEKISAYYPNSVYADDALYELANTQIILNDNRSAINNLNKIIKGIPGSSLVPKAMLKSALIYYTNNQLKEAESQLKSLIKNHPGTAEAREAVNVLKSVYIDQNDIEAYVAYLKSSGVEEISVNEQDSLTFLIAENFYLSANYNQAIPSLEEYLSKYPEGSYHIKARYFLADAYTRTNQKEASYPHYEALTREPAHEFSEEACLYAARLAYEDEDYENAFDFYAKLESLASDPFTQLESIDGQMRAAYFKRDWEAARQAAENLLNSPQTDAGQQLHAEYILGKITYQDGQSEKALTHFQKADQLSTSDFSAESKYMMAVIAFDHADFDSAETQLFELAEQYPASDYWVAKGFILLSDVYVAKDNVFQARLTLQSIIDNYKGPELGAVALEKLNQLNSNDE